MSVDVHDMKPGEEFPDRIKRLIDEAHVTIALIGEGWMPRRGANPSSDLKRDWVTHELEYSRSSQLAMPEEDCFELSKREIIPIFVNCKKSFDQFEIPSPISYLSDLHSEQIDYASWPRSIGPLLEGIADTLKLKKRLANKNGHPDPARAKSKTESLADEELKKILAYNDYDGWYIDNFGNSESRYIVKKFSFKDFDQAVNFMRLVSEHCCIVDHHPDWSNVHRHVTVSLSTWDAGDKVTIYDLSLALYMNMAAKAVAKP